MWGPQIQHISNRVAKNNGIINKLRYHLNLKVMKQLYHTLIFPYLNYGIVSWGNTYKTRLNTLCRRQNKCVRSIFFAHSRESSTPYYKLKIANFTHKILNNKENIPAVFSDFITRQQAYAPTKLDTALMAICTEQTFELTLVDSRLGTRQHKFGKLSLHT